MNVLYLNHSAQISGAENSLRALLWQFRRAHPEVEPVIALPGMGPYPELLRDEEWNVTFAPLRRLQRPNNLVSGMGALFHVLRTAPFVARLASRTGAQLIHSNSTTDHLVGGLAAGRTGKPAIWHVRDLVSLGRIAPALAQRATCVVAISRCVAQHLRRDGMPADKVRLIYNGLDPDEWHPRQRSQLRASLGLPEGAFLFGCVGQLTPWKNHAAFIEAAARLSQDENCAQAHFVILGGNLWSEHDDYVQRLRDLIARHNLQERVGFIPHQVNNVDALSAPDAIVLASRQEPFGRVLIEGMALRKVVIAYASHGPLEIITHEQDGLLVPPDEADGLANAMRRALHDQELRTHLRTNARETVRHKFHIADSARRVLGLYHEALS
jgi:glycosyltransferase involved in cell wall biosynthesis